MSLEVEFKYLVSSIPRDLIVEHIKERMTVISVRDIFYTDDYYVPKATKHHSTVPHIIRVRQDLEVSPSRLELTHKTGPISNHAYARPEHNIRIDSFFTTPENLDSFLCDCLDHVKVLSLEKSCVLITTPTVIITYDTIDTSMGHFYVLEIEAKNSTSLPIALDDIRRAEDKLGLLGASSQARETRSLFEIFTGKYVR